MLLKKEILLFYVLIIVSAGVIIAADQPNRNAAKKPAVKCCKLNPQPAPQKSTPPLYYITEGILRFKA